MKRKNILPEWVAIHKTKNTEIRPAKNGRYHMYRITSKWDKELKRSKKITLEFLGVITEEKGFMPKTPQQNKGCISSKDIVKISVENIAVKEYGIIQVIEKEIDNLYDLLQQHFDSNLAKFIIVISFLRFAYGSRFKRLNYFYEQSYISELFPNLNISPSEITAILREIGNNRENIVNFMKVNISKSKHLLFDGNKVLSKSEKMNINVTGKNKNGFDTQINQLYAFSYDLQEPSYYRILPGDISDIASFQKTIEESGITDAVVVGDKNFASDTNIVSAEKAGLKYVFPLKRDSLLFDKTIIKSGDKCNFDGFFLFHDRQIWHYKQDVESKKRTVHVFVDEYLKTAEEKDYLKRIEKNNVGYTIENFKERQYQFGAVILITNIDEESEETYKIYKTRMEIEEVFDCMRNLLDTETSYLQSEISLEGWGFLNHITAILLYHVYAKLRKGNLLKKYSAKDFIEMSRGYRKLKINGEWKTAETTKKTKDLYKLLGTPIT